MRAHLALQGVYDIFESGYGSVGRTLPVQLNKFVNLTATCAVVYFCKTQLSFGNQPVLDQPLQTERYGWWRLSTVLDCIGEPATVLSGRRQKYGSMYGLLQGARHPELVLSNIRDGV